MIYTVRPAACAECGAPMRLRENRTSGDRFLGCSRYPQCRGTDAYDPEVQVLAQEIVDLERQLARAISMTSPRLASPDAASRAAVVERVTKLIFSTHPDRNPDGVDPNAITRELLDLRRDIEAQH